MKKSLSVLALFAIIVFGLNLVSCGGTDKPKEEVKEVSTDSVVDLGLPSGKLWASCNLGADSPEKYGDYFAWGEVEKKDSFPKKGDNGYKHLGTLIGEDIAGTKYDAAMTVLGGDWKMPSQYDFNELVENCKWEWTKYKDVDGYKVTGKNGNSIFLPATGYCDPILCNQGMSGYYWTSTDVKGFDAITLSFEKGKRNIKEELRYRGQSIRPIKEKK